MKVAFIYYVGDFFFLNDPVYAGLTYVMTDICVMGLCCVFLRQIQIKLNNLYFETKNILDVS